MPRLLHRAVICAVALAISAQPGWLPLAGAHQIELPALGEAAADDLSPTDERKLGESIMQQVRRDPTYLADPDTLEYLNWIGYRLVAASPARFMDFTFFAIRDPTMNAFALPGGFIGVHSGLVLAAQTESELASVLAHEIGHVEQRHIARMISQQKNSTVIALGALLLAILAARSNSSSSGDLMQAAIVGGQAAAIQQQLNFSRDAEREADRVGFQTLHGAGFDPHGMVDFFTRLQQGTRIYESAAPAYLQTHPLTVERIADIQNRVQEAPAKQHLDSLDFQLIRARLRVLQDGSAQGFYDAQEHFATRLKERTAGSNVAAMYGLALSSLMLSQTAKAVEAAEALRRMTLAPSPMIDKLLSAARYADAKTDADKDAAIKLARDAAARFPLSRLTALHYVDLLQRDGRDAVAVAFLRDQLAITRSEITYYSLIAKSYAALGQRSLQHQAVAEAYALQGATAAAIEQLSLARKAADADFYTMAEIDARTRLLQQQLRDEREQLAREGRRPPDERSR